ncbi:MAG: SDR family oxidoreductase [Bacteroidota bacterium]|nr:SDR family oxidoreductase [Candidatus Kapabacteria bacterium]MCX7936366.1 SDR family oxidoreductase [Chlorobiota bacterium]MDW8271171.1 SDR family oxidoreductase [Bacteroidota bacterium]
MVIELHERVALVGGATQGIGWAIAIALARAGATVILLGRRQHVLAQRLEELENITGKKHRAIVVDYNSPTAGTDIIAALQQQQLSPDILINNVGGPRPGAIIDATPESFHQALHQLILVMHEVLQYVLPMMKHQQWGRIVNIISTSVRQPLEGLGVSNTIRAATAAWAKTLSLEVAQYGITVNNILPGATRTERLQQLIVAKAHQRNMLESDVEQEMLAEIPMRRFAQPEEIAALAVFLCSNFASYITGESIRVDGGRSRCL